ncbi:MAG: hypothetical protein ABIG03_03205 [Candidatus Eisenbacteria bacterium]
MSRLTRALKAYSPVRLKLVSSTSRPSGETSKKGRMRLPADALATSATSLCGMNRTATMSGSYPATSLRRTRRSSVWVIPERPMFRSSTLAGVSPEPASRASASSARARNVESLSTWNDST